MLPPVLTPVCTVSWVEKPSNHNSYDAFQHRRLIARFLAGDLKDVMDDKGKTMFPKNCECAPQREDILHTGLMLLCRAGKEQLQRLDNAANWLLPQNGGETAGSFCRWLSWKLRLAQETSFIRVSEPNPVPPRPSFIRGPPPAQPRSRPTTKNTGQSAFGSAAGTTWTQARSESPGGFPLSFVPENLGVDPVDTSRAGCTNGAVVVA